MKKIATLFSALLLIISCKEPRPVDAETLTLIAVDSMYRHHQYFVLRDQLNRHGHLLPKKELMLRKAQLLSVFNRRINSNQLIAHLQERYKADLSEKQKIDLFETQVSNNLFLYDYEAAKQAVHMLLANDSLSADKRKDYENQLLIFSDLCGTPPQEVKIVPDQLPLRKDLAGLKRIPVKINKIEQEVVFDTGANFSVITDSLAIKTGIKIKETFFKVTAITGEKVESRVGVADSLWIGNSLLRNVVFLVFPEASLSFEEANYTIDAILGFPVINALEKIELINEKKFVVARSGTRTIEENMALDLLTPIVEVKQDGRSLPFTFDTGASKTALYEIYLKLHEPFLLTYGLRDSIRQGGAGGSVRIPVYKASFSGAIGEREFKLDTANIHIKNQNDYPGIYGNLGQDILQQFDTLSIDFKNMRIELK